MIHEADTDSRAAIAAGFDRRGLSGLAELVRLGRDPLALPPLPALTLSPRFREERLELVTSAIAQQKRLLATYKPLITSGMLQQLLLLTSQSQDLRFIALSTHAYLLQFQIQDVYARTVRLLRQAVPVWDDLAGTQGDDTPDRILGREEVQEALRRVAGTAEPLQRATKAALTVLTDLHLGRFYKLSSGAQWTRIAAIEGLIRYGESELSRADRASGTAWRYLALARIRRYQHRLGLLAPQNDVQARTLWQTLLETRLGQVVSGEGTAGDASIRAALAVQRQTTEANVEARRNGQLWAQWVAQSDGIPENIATVLRLLTLDLERELAARAYLQRKD